MVVTLRWRIPTVRKGLDGEEGSWEVERGAGAWPLSLQLSYQRREEQYPRSDPESIVAMVRRVYPVADLLSARGRERSAMET